jgi:hypothetical protein
MSDMKKSLRRITLATLGVGLLALSVVTASQVIALCTAGQPSCLVAAVSFGVPEYTEASLAVSTTQAITTEAVATEVPTMTSLFISLLQVLSVYLILLSVMVLVVLEALELRYLRQLLKIQKA